MGNLPKDIKEHFFSNRYYRGMRLKNIKNPKTLSKMFKKYFKPVEMEFLKGLLAPSPGKRFTAKQALMHPYFQEMRAKDPDFADSASTKNTNSPSNVTVDRIRKPVSRYNKNKISVYEVSSLPKNILSKPP
jgi:serine/threonine protein kinase